MMRRGKHFSLPVCCLGLALLVACGPGNERKDVLPTERMADVLYDYQLAQTLSEQLADSVPTAPIEYRLSVFKKYGITAQEFDHSLAYYSRHADENEGGVCPHPKQIRAKRRQRPSRRRQRGTKWRFLVDLAGETARAHRPSVAARHLSRAAREESAEPRHAFALFSADWLYMQGLKQAASVVSVRYANDSTETFANGIYSYQRDQELRMTLGGSTPVREIEVQLMQNVGWQSYPQVLTLSNLRLVAVRPITPTP